MPDEDVEKTSWMIELGASYLEWYALTGRYEYLEIAVRTQAAALWRAPPDHSTRPLCLNALGSCYRLHYRRTGEIVDIDTAIAYHTQAVTSIRGTGANFEPICLQGLSTALLTRFQRLGDISDLDRSFEYGASATEHTPRGHKLRFVNLMQLGFSYRTRYRLFKKLEDIDTAIDCLTEVVSLAPTSRLAEMLNHLGSLHRHRFLQFNQLSDIHTAAELLTKSVSLTVSDDPNRPGRLTNLSTTLLARFNSLAQPDDIQQAIMRQHEAISIMPECHPENCTMMHELGAIYANQSRHFNDAASLMSALHWFELAAVHVSGQPQLQIEAALKWARINRSLSVPKYIDAFSRALELMPQFAWLGCVIGQRYERIATFSGVPVEAAAAAIELNRPDLALEWLEQGRSIVWTQILGLRTPIDGLRELDPDLADRLESVARRLSSGVVQDSATESGPMRNQMLDILQGTELRARNNRKPRYGLSSGEDALDNILASLWLALVRPVLDALGYLAAQTGFALLPGAVVELKMLREKTKCLESIYLDEEAATPKAVLSAMQKTSWVHLACHASQHLSDPTASGFQLHGGTLSLADMILHLKHGADLAFLSACETATGDPKVPDEAVHLAAGMLISGYRTVIGTMWSIKDEDAPLVSECFYSKMLEDGIPNNVGAARALHYAVGKLRDTIGEREFLRWIPYIHMGM
ncbi:CHAT domain protein [Ceratobasidium sp. AG-Ba]|nr:CHAT domain protein [Ceratobasidium sp. AG-Ba]QRW04587.1 CHAT domain protein [Ceratobasidium sp. AG-Ba]